MKLRSTHEKALKNIDNEVLNTTTMRKEWTIVDRI